MCSELPISNVIRWFRHVCVCVCVCVLDRFVECLTGLPKKSFKNLDDTLCLSASILLAAFRAVPN